MVTSEHQTPANFQILHEIAIKLAAFDPIDSEYWRCNICGAPVPYKEPHSTEHCEDCLYRKAVEYKESLTDG
jgi:hypothetical protein